MTPPVIPDFDPTDDTIGGNLSKGFHLLRAERRRQVIWCMSYLDSDSSVTVREVAKQIAAVEQGMPVRAVTNDDYRTVYTNLVQHHLPDLAEGSVVNYNRDRQIVSPGPNTEALVVMNAIAIPTIHLLLARDLD